MFVNICETIYLIYLNHANTDNECLIELQTKLSKLLLLKYFTEYVLSLVTIAFLNIKLFQSAKHFLVWPFVLCPTLID